MAQELWHSFEGGNTLYALIWDKATGKVFNALSGELVFYVSDDLPDYDIPLDTPGGQYYIENFPSDAVLVSGVYRVQIFLRTGGTPDEDDDIAVAQGEIYWDGTTEIDLLAVQGMASRVLNVYNET